MYFIAALTRVPSISNHTQRTKRLISLARTWFPTLYAAAASLK